MRNYVKKSKLRPPVEQPKTALQQIAAEQGIVAPDLGTDEGISKYLIELAEGMQMLERMLRGCVQQLPPEVVQAAYSAPVAVKGEAPKPRPQGRCIELIREWMSAVRLVKSLLRDAFPNAFVRPKRGQPAAALA